MRNSQEKIRTDPDATTRMHQQVLYLLRKQRIENKNAAVTRTVLCGVVAAFMADGECGRKGSAGL